jgi:hypothetical protein
MLLRGPVLGVALSAIFAFTLFHGWLFRNIGFAAGGLLGALFSVTAVFEAIARQRPSSLRRDVISGLAVTAFAFVSGLLVVFQAPYTVALLSTGSPIAALEVVEEAWLWSFTRNPAFFIALSLMLAPMFGVGTFARVRGLDRRGRALAAFVTPVLSAPGFLLAWVSARELAGVLGALLLGCLVAIPLLLELADFLERRLAKPER